MWEHFNGYFREVPRRARHRFAGPRLGLYINGTNFNDTLFGTAYADEIHGRFGNDFLSGGAGDDLLFGEQGNDSLFGGAGNDRLDGGAGNDMLTGGSGADALIGGEGFDTVKLCVVHCRRSTSICSVTVGAFGDAAGRHLQQHREGRRLELQRRAEWQTTAASCSMAAAATMNLGRRRLRCSQRRCRRRLIRRRRGIDVLTGGAGADHFVFTWDVGPDLDHRLPAGHRQDRLRDGFGLFAVGPRF